MNENLLGKCRACGREVSRRALECPDCREPKPTLTEQEYGKVVPSNRTWIEEKRESNINSEFYVKEGIRETKESVFNPFYNQDR